MTPTWSPELLAQPPDQAGAGLPKPREAGGNGGQAAHLSAARVRGRGAAAQGGARPGCGRPRLRAARRRLRRKLFRFHRQHHPRHVPRAAPDGGRAHVRRLRPRGQNGPHGRAVRQTALVRHRDDRGRNAAELSRRHHQRPRVHAGSPHPRSGAHGTRLLPVGRHAEPAARVRDRRLRRPARSASLEPRICRALAHGGAIPRPGTPHRRDPRLHAGLRHHQPVDAADPRDRLLHQPRGAAAAVPSRR